MKFLPKVGYNIVIPESVYEEVGNNLSSFVNLKVDSLRGKSLNLAKSLGKLGIGKGEAECLALAIKHALDSIICDDRKLVRQIFFSNNKILKKIKLLGFSFFLHEFFKKGLIKNIWAAFDLVIDKNNWKRSEVQVANYTFLKGMGY